jgi:hypothetical protein
VLFAFIHQAAALVTRTVLLTYYPVFMAFRRPIQ